MKIHYRKFAAKIGKGMIVNRVQITVVVPGCRSFKISGNFLGKAAIGTYKPDKPGSWPLKLMLYLSYMLRFLFICCLLFASCRPVIKIQMPVNSNAMTGTGFYEKAAAMQWKARDSLAVKEILSGNMPGFLKKFVAVNISIVDSSTGKEIKATYYVSPDYLSIGTDKDWARVNITPMAAQQIADSLHCFLPTKKMVDDIYRAARIKLEPVPMYALRDSTPTMWQHHLIIEGLRKGRKGLIAGIKKDVVLSAKIYNDKRGGRVAIYGWHKLDGKPIQPLYTGHINWWVDYSQGIRLVYRKIKMYGPNRKARGQWMDYMDVLKDPLLQKLLCDETLCDFYRYN
jgi:hypothetical protein